MERKALVLGLGELAVRFSEGWHEGIKIDALDIVLLNEAAEALAQTEQEPVAVVAVNQSGGIRMEYQDGSAFDISKHVGQRFYTASPQRTWVGLTDEEIQPRLNGLPTQSIAVYARNIEAILKDKNT